MSALGKVARAALLGAAAHPDGMLTDVHQRTAIALEERGYVGLWPLLPGRKPTRIADLPTWPLDVPITPAGRAEAERLGAAPAPSRLLVIPCGGAKRTEWRSWPAGELYVGSYHRACRAAADRLAAETGARVVVLSAWYGLVSLQRPLWTYDVTVGDPRTVKPETIRRQSEAMGVLDADVTVLAGSRYVRLAREVFPDAAAPLAGTRGIGEQLARLKRIRFDGSQALAA
ncbi:DUF6884 domain-containing protein [Actinacidiphila sp. bgisy160]|uniref:DUF6884 domain-containing protein n=1 Tax=Actinacidiphila sp. bgisy160 TaxID=3413796 RepID=UPI003D740598